MASPKENFTPENCVENYKSIFSKTALSGKVAFITGGGSGIGFTISEVLMRHGCNVAIASRNFAKLQSAQSALQKAVPGAECFIAQMDVRKPAEVKACVDQILSKFNRIDILVNNSAGNFLCLAEGLSSNAYRNVIDIDTVGTFTTSKTVYEAFFKKNGGVIINIGATLHVNGQVLQCHAGSAKAAIEAMTKHLAVEWGPDNVRIVCISPGPIADTVGYSKLGGSVFTEEQIAQSIPIQRVGRRIDIANTVLFAVSDAGSYITGTNLVVDGGAVLTASNGMHGIAQLLNAHSKL